MRSASFLTFPRRAQCIALRKGPGAVAKTVLPRDERRATCRATLLGIVIREHDAFSGKAVDVGRLVAHHTVAVTAQVRYPDVIAHDDEDVWPFLSWGSARYQGQQHD